MDKKEIKNDLNINAKFNKGIYRPPGRLRIAQIVGNSQEPVENIRDFDNEKWSHHWIVKEGVPVLAVREVEGESNFISGRFFEFSLPVVVEFTPED